MIRAEEGRTVSEIAAELDLTAGTVSGHLQKVKAKLGAPSVAELVSYAHRIGLIDRRTATMRLTTTKSRFHSS